MPVKKLYFNKETGFIRVIDQKKLKNGTKYTTKALMWMGIKDGYQYMNHNFMYKKSLHGKMIKNTNVEDNLILLLESRDQQNLTLAAEIIKAKFQKA